MLFTISFRLTFCDVVSKEGCDRKESVIAKRNYIFKATRLVTSFILFIWVLENWNYSYESRFRRLTITNSTVSASYSVKTKQGIDRKSSSERSCRLVSDKKNLSFNNYRCHFSLFASFIRESTQDSDGYNLVF